MRRTLLITLLGPLALLASLAVLAVTMGPQYVPAGWHATADKWRPEVERVNVQTQIPIDTSGVLVDIQFERGPTYLALPTSAAEDEQCLHPDVVYAPQGFASHNWWMVMSPYPATNPATYETADILCSDDGVTWTDPGTNPIVALDAGYLIYDPSLLLNDGKLYCFYQKGLIGKTPSLYCKTSTDGITWSTPYTVISDSSTIWAPVVRNVKGTFYMWCTDCTAGANDGVMKRRSASSPLGPYSAASTVTLTGFSGAQDPWHVNVQQFGDKYILAGTSAPGRYLYMGFSTDGLTFSCQRVAVPAANVGAWDDNIIGYQAAVVQRDDRSFDVFYGGQDGTSYFIGRGVAYLLPHPRYNKTPLMRSLEILGTECVGFWPFLEPSGTNIDDLRGLHDLTASEDFGRFDTAPAQRMPVYVITFNGTDEGASFVDDDHFSFGDGLVDSAYSVGAWVYLANTAAERDIIGKFDSGNSWKEWYLYVTADEKGGLAQYDQSVANGWINRVTDAAISTGAWHQLIVTSNVGSANMVIYVDGAAVASTAGAGAGAYVAMENLGASLTLGYTTAAVFANGFNQKASLEFITAKNLTAWEVRMLYEYQKLLMGL